MAVSAIIVGLIVLTGSVLNVIGAKTYMRGPIAVVASILGGVVEGFASLEGPVTLLVLWPSIAAALRIIAGPPSRRQ